jgi:N-acyl-D-amino-acid deacylase
MGLKRRAPDADELMRMRRLVEKAMDAGAMGLSTGLIYVPGTYAQTDELIELARVVAPRGGVYASHIRNENDQLEAAVEEALRIGREAGVPVQISHLKATGRPNWGKGAWLLERIARARAEGQTVHADQYAYPASSTSLDILFPSAELEIGRERMSAALQATMDRMGFADFRYCRIAHAPGSATLDGLTIPEAAQRLRGAADRTAQAETVVDIMAKATGRRVSMIYFTIGEEDIVAILKAPFVAVASDAGIRGGEGKPHPRACGNNPRVLGRYARDEATLPLELAVHKMSGLPARAFSLRDRGVVALGMAADLVVFDPARVADRATWDEPTLPPDGMPWVLVNGTPVVEQGQHTGARPGKVLRRRP